MSSVRYLLLVALALSPCVEARGSAILPAARVDFLRQVQPILKARCYQCHGAGENDGGFRLDSRALVLKGGDTGPAIVPGDASKSLLMARLLGLGGKPRMPLGFAPLLDSQMPLIRAWINQGATWPEAAAAKKHWAYVKPVRPATPKVKDARWVRNPIDAFILARLERQHIKPSPEADPVTLLRRVTLDLTGLPPTPAEVDAFLADHSPAAYDKVVTRLLASPHYGEKMAMPWLDAARYADSNGFQQDGDTSQYIWRDWVVRAYNDNMPFDQFTIDQLAGDLLPNATLDQKIATGFNRCNMLNGEGGAIAEEQRNIILFDRVDVTATNWLGATLACAQCHDHKYDPLTQRDYYSFMAFFNNVPESGVPPGGGQYRIAEPWISDGTPDQMAKLSDLKAGAAAARTKADSYQKDHQAEIQALQMTWEAGVLKDAPTRPRLDPWHAVGPFTAASFEAAYDTAFEPEKRVDLTAVYGAGKLLWAAHPEWDDGNPHVLMGENTATYLYRVIHADAAQKLNLSLGSDDAIKAWINGKQVVADKAMRAVAPDQDKVTIDLKPGDNQFLMKIVNGGGIGGFYFSAAQVGVPDAIRAILTVDSEKRSVEDAKKIRAYYLTSSPPTGVKAAEDKSAAAAKAAADFEAALPKVMVMSDARPRKTHILERGNYMMPGPEVQADVPACFPPLPPGAPHNRLGLAEWLMSPDNPLTARVQVNRYWQIFWGVGLVKTSENLGTQCDPPSYPDLLDWLAVEFRESGWDIKHIVRLIVTSAAYRQSSRITPAMQALDPENRLMARGARFRLPSMLLRDDALAASGLLNDQIGGKPVYPYQPKGIWDGLAITKERDFTYPQSTGKDLYRRSLYTFWRRTVAPANMFDASVRNTCKVRLAITSTPLQALTMLNDVTWVEASRVLAEHVMKEAGPSSEARLSEAFRRICARRPTRDELRILQRSLDRALAAFGAQPTLADSFLKEGASPRDKSFSPVEEAAYANVCLAIFNLDEAMTRE